MEQGKKILLYSSLSVLALYFFIGGLVYAKAFLIPLFAAMVLAFLMLPVNDKLEKWRCPKILATFASTLVSLIVIAGIATLVLVQISIFAKDWDNIQRQARGKLTELNEFLLEHTPLRQRIGLKILEEPDQQDRQGWQGPQEQQEQQEPQEQQEQQKQEDQDAAEIGAQVVTTIGVVFWFLGQFLLTMVYVFLFIYFRDRFEVFILRFFPKEKRREVAEIITVSASKSRKYLAGRLLLMVILAVLYYAGLAISGLENAFFIALISAALSIIPIAGNFIGFFIAVIMSSLTGGDFVQVLGITITFIVAQLIDTYILQPVVLGSSLDVHPIFIIVSVIAGFEIWGIMGMVLAIPLFAIVSEICRHVPALSPFGYLFSSREVKEPEEE